jgi:hypothetical protein
MHRPLPPLPLHQRAAPSLPFSSWLGEHTGEEPRVGSTPTCQRRSSGGGPNQEKREMGVGKGGPLSANDMSRTPGRPPSLRKLELEPRRGRAPALSCSRRTPWATRAPPVGPHTSPRPRTPSSRGYRRTGAGSTIAVVLLAERSHVSPGGVVPGASPHAAELQLDIIHLPPPVGEHHPSSSSSRRSLTMAGNAEMAENSSSPWCATVTTQNVISMLVLHHEHNGFAKIKFLGLFK